MLVELKFKHSPESRAETLIQIWFFVSKLTQTIIVTRNQQFYYYYKYDIARIVTSKQFMLYNADEFHKGENLEAKACAIYSGAIRYLTHMVIFDSLTKMRHVTINKKMSSMDIGFYAHKFSC